MTRETQPPLLIGLAGPAGSGKSTIANAIVRKLDHAGIYSFAAPLKAALKAMGLTDAQLYGDEKDVPCALLGGKTPRHAMKTLGTEWGRGMIDDDFWVRSAMLRADSPRAAGMSIVFDDVRFDNEAAAIIARGGTVFELRRPGVKASSEHASEAGLSVQMIQYLVPNTDTPVNVAGDILWLARLRNQAAQPNEV